MLRRVFMAGMFAMLLAGCSSETVEERKLTGDSQHTYRYYYDKNHHLTKKETYLNGNLERTEDYTTP